MANNLDFAFDFNKLVLDNGRTIEQQLIREAENLKTLVIREIGRWYKTYIPKLYSRTYDMRNSIYVDTRVNNSNDGITVSVKYDDRVFHKSLWGKKRVNVLLLTNYGYQVKSGWHKNIPYFGFRSAGNYLEYAVKAFESSSYLGLKAEIELKSGDLYR